MTIKPNDPWYPCPFEFRKPVAIQEDGNVRLGPGWHPGVTIRLKLAAMAMQGMASSSSWSDDVNDGIACDALAMADAMIERANREESDVPPRPEKTLVAAIALLDEWMADKSGYDEATWPVLKRGLMGWK